jgi:acetolactate synthase-1/2/3 large subunit
VDSEEHKKKTVKIDYLFESDAKLFLKDINSIKIKKNWNRWLEKCNEWKEKWLTIQPEYNEKEVNKYEFIKALSEQLPSDSVVVTDAGSSGYVTYQSLRIKSTKQRLITSGAQMDMGFTIPASIGVSVASNNKTVVGITGDGSFQLNIQELQTIVHNQIPVKIFVWNNNGYLSIRTTQHKFFNKRYYGTDSTCGVSFPSTEEICKAYGLRFFRIENRNQLKKTIEKTLSVKKPVICEVICPTDQEIIPNVSSVKRKDGTLMSKPLEDMYPFLDRNEFYNEMIIKPIEEK